MVIVIERGFKRIKSGRQRRTDYGEEEDLSDGQPMKLCSPNTLGAMNTIHKQPFHLVIKVNI